MTRSENDLRAALRSLEQRADQQGAPSGAGLLDAAMDAHRVASPRDGRGRFPRWLAPAAAAAAVAATAITAVTLSTHHATPSRAGGPAPDLSTARSTAPHVTAPPSIHSSPTSAPATSAAAQDDPAAILDDAATKLAATPWTAPAPDDFYYVRTNQATTWTSVSGAKEGDGRGADGTKIWVSGCANGQIVSGGESGGCTLNDVPHYLGDAPTAPADWDAYLEQMAPGAKAGGAQGKIIVQVLHQDLVSPQAAAALLRYTETCPGLHTVDIAPVAGEQLTAVTCTSMTNGSYALVFDTGSHQFVGYAGVTGDGTEDGPAELVQQTGIVPAVGRTP